MHFQAGSFLTKEQYSQWWTLESHAHALLLCNSPTPCNCFPGMLMLSALQCNKSCAPLHHRAAQRCARGEVKRSSKGPFCKRSPLFGNTQRQVLSAFSAVLLCFEGSRSGGGLDIVLLPWQPHPRTALRVLLQVIFKGQALLPEKLFQNKSSSTFQPQAFSWSIA